MGTTLTGRRRRLRGPTAPGAGATGPPPMAGWTRAPARPWPRARPGSSARAAWRRREAPPDTIGAAAPPLHDAYALLPIFGWMIPLFVLTAVVALLLPEVPLSRKTGMEQVAEAGGDQ